MTSALAQPVRLAARRARAFSTRQATDGEPVRQWEQHNAEALIALACTTPAGGAFDGVEVNLQLDQVHLARVLGSSHRVDRSTALIEERPADAIAVYVPMRGDALLEYAGRRRVLRPGQILLCDADQPHVRGFGRGLEELAVKVPRSNFAALTGSATVELVAVLARGHSGDAPLAHRAAARAYIDEHFTDPHLAAADIAAGAGEEIGRILTWGTHPAREADYRLASPGLIVDIPQTYLEPILVKHATMRGAQTRFSTEYLSHTQNDEYVDVQVLDRITGAEYTSGRST